MVIPAVESPRKQILVFDKCPAFTLYTLLFLLTFLLPLSYEIHVLQNVLSPTTGLQNVMPQSSEISCPLFPTFALIPLPSEPSPCLMSFKMHVICSPKWSAPVLQHFSSAPLPMFSEMFCPPCSSDHLPAPSPLKFPASLALGPSSCPPCSAPGVFPVLYTFSNFPSFLFSSLFFPFSLFSFFFFSFLLRRLLFS